MLNASPATQLFDLATHPTDPLKLAVVANRGVFVSSDGGASLRLYGGYQPRALAYSAGGTLYLATSTVLASSADQLSFTNYGTWPDAANAPQAMTIRADGTIAAIGVVGGSGGATETYVGPAGGALTFEDSGLVNAHVPQGVTWLADVRLLVLMHVSNEPGGPAERKRLAVRAAAGGWTAMEARQAEHAEDGNEDAGHHDGYGVRQCKSRPASWLKLCSNPAQAANYNAS